MVIIDIILKMDCLMVCTTGRVCLVSAVSGCRKTLLKASTSSGQKTKQEGLEGSQGCLMFAFVLCRY